MLKFLGIGDAFSSSLGNTSAFYKKDNSLILIDCGENIFERIIQNDILSDIDKVYIIITHFHSDHIGSIGTLLFYLDKIGIKDTSIIYPNKKSLTLLLKLFGVQKCNYEVLSPSEEEDFNIREIKQSHSFMEAYGYLMRIDDKTIYYSGDTKSLSNEVLEMLMSNEIDYFYQDIREGINDYHISLEELNGLVPIEYRDKIQCMHISESINRDEITRAGYRLVKEYRR